MKREQFEKNLENIKKQTISCTIEKIVPTCGVGNAGNMSSLEIISKVDSLAKSLIIKIRKNSHIEKLEAFFLIMSHN